LVIAGMGAYWQTRTRIYDLGPGVTPPVSLASVKPGYTSGARATKIQGTVRVACVVGRNGICADVAVVRSLDRHLGLDEAAVRAARGWRFKPALVQGEPVAARIQIDFRFALR
jgi:protein TonB